MSEFGIEKWSIYRSLSLTTTGELISGTSARLHGCIISNTNAADRFVKLYNTATAPVIGTDTPVMTLLLIANTVIFLSGLDLFFSTGLGVGASTGVADSDTGAPSANDVVGNFFYAPGS